MNECDCPRPPGGRVVCSDEQLAMCVVDDFGNVETGCLDRPKTVLTSEHFENWILESVMGLSRSPDATIRDVDREVLRAGTYIRRDGSRVTFRVPRDDRWPGDFGSSGGSPQGGFGALGQAVGSQTSSGV